MDEDLRARYRMPPHQRALNNHTRPSNYQSPKSVYSPNLELAAQSQEHQSALPQPAKNRKTQVRRRRVVKFLSILFLLSIIAAFAALWAYPKYAQPNPFSPALRNSINIALFYPQKLPAGYTVDQSSFQTTSNEVIFNANNSSSRLVFTQQKIPSSFDFNSFYAQQFKQPIHFDTIYGHVVIGKNDYRNLGSLVSHQTWLLLTTNSPQPSIGDMSLVLHNLKQY